MDKNDVRIDIRDEQENIHEVYITQDLHLVIWTMNKSAKTSHKDYGKIHPMELFNRGAEIINLARKYMKEHPDED